MTIKKILNNSAGLIPIIPVALYFLGLWHSHKKHKEDSDNIFWMVYRGAEMFWHDDYAGVNWRDKVNDDAGTAIQLITSTNSLYKIDEVKKQSDEFAEKISKYPNDKKDEIQKIVKDYLSFIKMVTSDFTSFINNFDANEDFHFSSKTEQKYDSLNNYYKIGGTESFKKVIDSLVIVIKNDKENISEYRERINLHNLTDDEFIKKAYYRIFKENL